jgi:hypothetical protein
MSQAAIKVIRFQANESEFTEQGRNRTEVSVPASVGFTDLTGSKVVLDMHVDVFQGATRVPLPVTFGNQEMVAGPQSLIRNSRVVSSSNGLLNERRYANVIDANLDWYSQSRAQEDQHTLTGYSNTQSYGIDRASGLPDCPFIMYSRPTPTVASTATPAYTRRAEVPVAFKHIDNFGNMPQFPNLAVGNLTYNIEFENQVQTVFPAAMPSRAFVPCVDTAAVANRLKTLTLQYKANQLYRLPQIGDLCTAYFLNTTDTAAYAPLFTAGVSVAVLDEIIAVSIVSNTVAVTLKTGFGVTTATAACTKILLGYFSPMELDPLTPNTIPVPICNNITPSGGAGNAAAPVVFARNTLGGIEATLNAVGTLTTTRDAFKSLPWYVGAPVTLAGIDSNSDTPVRIETFIASVTVDVIGGSPTYNTSIVLVDTLATVGVLRSPSLTFRDSKAVGNVFTSEAAKFTCTWTVDELYLELLQLQLTPSMMDKAMKSLSNVELPFYDQLLIQKNMPSTTVHTEVISLLPNTVGVSVLTPQNLSLVSGFDSCLRYRFALNGKETTNQDINVGSAVIVGRQIHNVLLREHLLNIGKQLKKYDAPKFCYEIDVVSSTHAMYGLVVPAVPAETIMQLQLFSDVAMASKNIYYVLHVQRVLKLGGGKAMVM